MKQLFIILLISWFWVETYADDYSDCFIPGEVSEYKASWMGLPLAWSRTTTESITENGRELIRIQMVSKSYKAYSAFYKVDDAKEVIIDPKTALPLRIDLRMNEGNVHASHLTLFDHTNHTAIIYDRIANTTNQVEITDQTRDVVTFLFAMRNETPEDLSKNMHTLLSGGKLYEMSIKVRKDGRVRVPGYGKVDCTKVEPIAEFDGLFLRKGEILFWISKQERRMITCIKTQVPVGKITVKLQSVSGPGDDFWVTTDK